MAEMLEVPQSSISRIEHRTDMYLSTLRNYIHAVGGGASDSGCLSRRRRSRHRPLWRL
jgi:hypothetical protein